MAEVVLKKVRKTFGKSVAVSDIDLDVDIRIFWSWWGHRAAAKAQPCE